MDRNPARSIHPLHAALIAGALPLVLGAFLADIAYARSFEVQWKNFASWLIAGALVFAGCALLWAVVDLVRFRSSRAVLYFGTLLAAWALGLVNALVHAKDGWASMPAATILSIIVAILITAATAFALSPGSR
ncbi:hypothetical protein H9L13_09395 [Sphingomonas lutea]|uniref:DUF2231 domain-containing protein n=1 Tax=Sphingomonas lutea TaxID=1045317 RepID=A0A7G9SG92_9SPHN|nr:DUF2231 domain-containing protein [Sphingomonas lutea]QNN66867.1 hypothetical protein H9L13_09395 [Sphingomonas lutea]